MRMDWNKYLNFEMNITLHENYGMVHPENQNEPFYEIVFKAGILKQVFDDGLMLLTSYKNRDIEIYIPFTSIKCVDIIHPEKSYN